MYLSLLYSHKDIPRIADLLQNGRVDVWQYSLNGTVDFRISKKEFDALVPSPECAVLIEDVGEYVRQAAEDMMKAKAMDGDWFESYVSHQNKL